MKSFTLLLTILLMTGCTTQLYKVQTGSPAATLTENLYIDNVRHASNNVTIEADGKSYQAMFLYGNSDRPKKSLQVEANKPLIITYRQSNNNETCVISTKATLQANRNYLLVGGYHYGKTGFWVEKGHNFCSLAVKDNLTHEIISTPLSNQ